MAIKADHTAAVKRAARYGITLREDGHLTKPSEFADVADEQFGDPANYAYPCDTPERARAAVAYWGQRKNQAEYTPADRAVIEARIKKLATAQGVTVAAFGDAEEKKGRGEEGHHGPALSHDEIAKLLAAALGVSTYDIQDVYADRVVYYQYPGGVEALQSERKLYQQGYTLADGKVTLGGKATEVTRRSVYDPVVKMAAEFTEEEKKGGGEAGRDFGSDEASPALVPYTGKVFEIGAYPDKEFSLTEAEADAAIAAFAPVANDYEHQPGMFDGKLGRLQRVWREGANLMGEMLIPRQVRELAGRTLQTSLSWARESKQIIGNALTATPRVSDATLTAAFSGEEGDGRGRAALGTLPHSAMDNHSALDIHKKKEKAMTLKEKFLALFSGGKKPEELSEEELARFAAAEFPTSDGAGKGKGKKAETVDCPDCDGSGDCPLCDGAGTVAADASDDELEKKRAKAGYMLIPKGGKEKTGAHSTSSDSTGSRQAQDEKGREIKADMADSTGSRQAGSTGSRQAEDPVITGIKAKQVKAEAEALFASGLQQGKVLPAQQASFVTLFTALHKADNGGAVTFTATGNLKNGDGVKALAEFLGSLPANPALFAEMLQAEAAKGNLLTFATPKGGTNGAPSAERMAELRKMGGLAAK